MTQVRDADALLLRDQAAEALTEAGFKTSPATLATKATRGGGPPYRLYGRRPLYRWGDLLVWAQNQLSDLRCSTSERDAAQLKLGAATRGRHEGQSNSIEPAARACH